MAQELASVDGRITPTTEAVISLPDDGLYRGDGVFEVVRLYGGRPFALREHLDRLDRSATAIDLIVDRGSVERELPALLDRFGADDGQLRIVITRGGRRILLTEELPPRAETIRLATVTYSPSVIFTRAQIVSELHVEEGEFEVGDALAAHEAFLASTTREVQAVSAIDGQELEAPGPRTVEAGEAFAGALERTLATPA